MAGFEINPGWRAEVGSMWQVFADGRLGEGISDDARRYCPVRTGALKASIEHHMEGDDLIVSATGGGEDEGGNLFVSGRPGRLTPRTATLIHPNPGRNTGSLVTRQVHHVDEGARAYAVWIELGHRVFHPSTRTVGPGIVAPRSFLRVALYQHRS